MASSKNSNSRFKMKKTATLGEFRKANRVKKPVHFFPMNIVSTKFDNKTSDTDFDKWYIPSIERRFDKDTGIKFDQGSFHGYKLKTVAIGEPFHEQKWKEPIPGQIEYPGEARFDGVKMFVNHDEEIAFK
jgi:hypothetical protein